MFEKSFARELEKTAISMAGIKALFSGSKKLVDDVPVVPVSGAGGKARFAGKTDLSQAHLAPSKRVYKGTGKKTTRKGMEVKQNLTPAGRKQKLVPYGVTQKANYGTKTQPAPAAPLPPAPAAPLPPPTKVDMPKKDRSRLRMGAGILSAGFVGSQLMGGGGGGYNG